MKVTITFLGREYRCAVKQEQYQRGGTAITLTDLGTPEEDEMPLEWVLSVCFPESAKLPPGAFYLKDWSENEEVAARQKRGIADIVTICAFYREHSRRGSANQKRL